MKAVNVLLILTKRAAEVLEELVMNPTKKRVQFGPDLLRMCTVLAGNFRPSIRAEIPTNNNKSRRRYAALPWPSGGQRIYQN